MEKHRYYISSNEETPAVTFRAMRKHQLLHFWQWGNTGYYISGNEETPAVTFLAMGKHQLLHFLVMFEVSQNYGTLKSMGSPKCDCSRERLITERIERTFRTHGIIKIICNTLLSDLGQLVHFPNLRC